MTKRYRTVPPGAGGETIRPVSDLWLAPFGAIAVLIYVSGVLFARIHSVPLILASGGVLALTFALGAFVHRRPVSPWLAVCCPAAYVVSLALLSAAHGWAWSGVAAALVLPVAWSALYHRLQQAIVPVVLELGLVVAISTGDHASTGVGVRHTVIWGLTCAVILLAASRLRDWAAAILDDRQEALRQTEVLGGAARELNASLDSREVIDTAVRLVAEIASPPGTLPRRANYCVIVDGQVIVDVERDDAGEWVGSSWPVQEHQLLARAVATGRPTRGALSAGSLGPTVAPLARAQGVAHGGWVPVHVGGELHGVMAVAGRNGPITEQELGWCAAVVQILELALTNALLHEYSRHAAHTDPLTSLANRRGLEALVVERRGRRPFTVLAIDVDRLKEVNDRYGHAAGDAMLKGVALAIASALRVGDAVARTGGDEFVCVLFDSEPESAISAAERVLDAVAAVDAVDGRCRVSVGVAHAGPEDALDWCLDCADGAMYEAKRAGGMRFVVAGDAPAAQLA